MTSSIETSLIRKKLFNIISSLTKATHDLQFPQPPLSQPLPDYFGEYFTKKIDDIRQTFHESDEDHLYQSSASHSLSAMRVFHPATVETVREIVKSMPNKSSTLDAFPTALVKRHIDVLLPHFVAIINKSLDMSHVPTQLKSAIVVPILKKDSLPPELKNYRPIPTCHS